jgi:uncharacterized protein YjeT (DUF2065 family)
MTPFAEMFRRLRAAPEQSRAAKTVELYGWLLLLEGGVILIFPHFVASLLRFAPLQPDASNLLRLAGVLVAGIGMLYTISGRLNAEGFVFASLLDRPVVPPVAGLLWYFGFLPGPLALLFALEDFSTWLWTLLTWRADMRRDR